MNDDPDGLRQFGADPHHYRFVRNTKLKPEDFDQPWMGQVDPDKVVLGASVVAFALGLLVVWISAW